VRDHDHDAAGGPQRPDGMGERFLAVGVEIGVGLIEKRSERVPVHGAGEAERCRWPAESAMPPSPILVS